MHEAVNHPQHYGGKDNPFEAIKVIEAWGLGFCLGNSLKYISRAGKKLAEKIGEDLEKALWYLDREIDQPGMTQPVASAELPPETVWLYTPSTGAISAAWNLDENLHTCVCCIFESRRGLDSRSRLITARSFLKTALDATS